MLFANQNREVSEWLKELAWKASIWVTVSRVRIPSSLRIKSRNFIYEIAGFLFEFWLYIFENEMFCFEKNLSS